MEETPVGYGIAELVNDYLKGAVKGCIINGKYVGNLSALLLAKNVSDYLKSPVASVDCNEEKLLSYTGGHK